MVRTALLFALAMTLSVLAPLGAQTPAKTAGNSEFKILKDLDCFEVLSQDVTGTCWSFATVSFLESEVARSSGKRVDLSEMYPVYFTYLEKGRRYLDQKGKSQFSQGGLSHDLTMVLEKYGVAPQSAYNGLCPGDKRHSHSELEVALKSMLDGLAKRKDRRGRSKKPSPKWEAAYRGILDGYIGRTPDNFTVGDESFTPKTYAASLGIEAKNYVELMSQVSEPMWKNGILDVPDNWERKANYKNLPIDDMMRAIDHALNSGFSVALDCDVSEKGWKPHQGFAKVGEEMQKPGAITDKLRGELFVSKETTDDHLMHIVGLAENAKGEPYYIVKNSWGQRVGAQLGDYRGHVFMSRAYVALKTLAVMVHKDGLPADIKAKFEL